MLVDESVRSVVLQKMNFGNLLGKAFSDMLQYDPALPAAGDQEAVLFQ